MRLKEVLRMIVFSIIFHLLLASAALAIDLGNGFTLDGHAFGGKLWDVDRDVRSDYEQLRFTSRESSWFVSSEIGLRYGIVRPYFGYETLTHDYDRKTAGLDLIIFSDPQFGSIGVRTAWATHRRYGLDTQRYLATGLLWRF
ncbi:MAG: hypothetical protein OHK006_13040 [Thermodesulfovibrionales bacterium]